MLHYIHVPLFVFVVSLISVFQISDSRSENLHNGDQHPKRLAESYHMPPNLRGLRKYKDYSDYGQAPDVSKKQWENTLSRQQDISPWENVTHRRKEQSVDDNHLHCIDKWPDPSKKLGQLSAVSIDMDGNVVVFHRGDRTWNGQTFLPNNVYNERDLGPIKENTVVVFNVTTGKVVREWGSNMFFLPHGLTVDSKNNIWLTDVALHQVFKFSSNGKEFLVLGTRFIPANDDNHFCKPSDVAVMSSGEFFVSDGYCNTRVMKYSKGGKLLMQWGRSSFQRGSASQLPAPYEFSVPHALTLAEDKNLVCVADRENGRIQCFNTYNGSYIMQFHSPRIGSRLFSVAYSYNQGGLLHVVNGPDQVVSVKGFVISLDSNQIIEEFEPNTDGFKNPHDIAVSSDGTQVYVVELNPFRVWKFARGNVMANVDMKTETGTMGTNNSSASSLAMLNLSKLPMESLNPEDATRSFAAALGISISALAVLFIIITVAIIRIRKRGYKGRFNRWEFPKSPVEGFKLGQFLDRHQGFEKVNTEESDDEGSNDSAELSAPSTHFA